jgi:hypothetical protein
MRVDGKRRASSSGTGGPRPARTCCGAAGAGCPKRLRGTFGPPQAGHYLARRPREPGRLHRCGLSVRLRRGSGHGGLKCAHGRRHWRWRRSAPRRRAQAAPRRSRRSRQPAGIHRLAGSQPGVRKPGQIGGGGRVGVGDGQVGFGGQPVQACGREYRLPGERALPPAVAEAVTSHVISGREGRTRAGPGDRAHQIPAHDKRERNQRGIGPDPIRVSTRSTQPP